MLATVTGEVPGLDQQGRPNTLLLLQDTEHFYPSSKYSHDIRYVILPYARFVAGGILFCAPGASAIDYYPEAGDRLLIAADSRADRDAQALTVMGLRRVVRVEEDDALVTYGRSDFNPGCGMTQVAPTIFPADFPATLAEARDRAWQEWWNGYVDLADKLGHGPFTWAWKTDLKAQAEALRPGCFVADAHQVPDGAVTSWLLSASCPPSEKAAAAIPGRRHWTRRKARSRASSAQLRATTAQAANVRPP